MKGKNDIRYNGSGYYDETAFKAIKNTDRGGIHNMKEKKVYKGEIWETETNTTARENKKTHDCTWIFHCFFLRN